MRSGRAPPTSCPHCRNGNRPGARFCDSCGTPLAAETPAAPPAVPAMSPVLDGEVKHVTVLFADIVDSTRLVAARSPDEAGTILAPAVAAMAEAVRAFGGTVNRVLGDGIMALFGVPVSHEDQAIRACCAAFRMHEAVATALPADTRLRIGLASGRMLTSAQGAESAGAYPAFGATIHLAARLEAMARPGTTRCDAGTRALARAAVEFVPLGLFSVRGFETRQEVFELAALRPNTSRFAESLARGLSPFVGREAELGQLLDRAEAVRATGSAALGIVGEAGAGKSRLAWEFEHALAARAWRIVRAEALSYGRDMPYQLITALVRAALESGLPEDPAEPAGGPRACLAALGLAERAPALLALLGLPLEDDEECWRRLDPLHRRDAMRDGVAALFDTLARRQPTVLMVEDLQWADEESIRLLDLLPSAEARLLLVATLRPGFAPDWSRLVLERTVLQPLPAASMERLLAEAFPGISAPLGRRQALVRRSAGNPFFLEELARDALAAGEATTGVEGAPAIPSSIQAVVAARIDRLDAEAKRLLVAASVLGTRFPQARLRAIVDDMPPERLAGRLDALAEAGMLRPVRAGDEEIAFWHALIQEVAYAGLTSAQRRDLHRRVVRTVRRVDAERLDELAEELVYHAARGEAWAELVDAARTAGRRAASRSAYGEASRFFDQAIQACKRLPRSRAVLADEIDLRFDLRTAIFPTAGIERSLENSTQNEALARELDDPRRLGWATAYLARDQQLTGRPTAAMITAARVQALAGEDRDLATAARYFAAQAAYSRGEYAWAVETLRGLIRELEARDRWARTGTPGPSIIFFRTWLTWSLAQLGEAEASIGTAREMLRLAEEADLPLCRTKAHLSEGFALALAGRHAEAEPTLRVSLDLCRKWELFAWSTNIMSCLGHVVARLGRPAEAFELLEEATERTRRSGVLVNHANELAWLGEAHRLAGDPERAARLAEEAVCVAVAHEELGNEALARVVHGEALADLGAVGPARRELMAALRLANAAGMRPLVIRCRAGALGGPDPLPVMGEPAA